MAAARRRRALTACAVVALTIAVIAAAVVVSDLPIDDSTQAETTPDLAWNELDIAAAGGALLPATSLTRPVYLHSVVAGGAYTPAELRAAIGADPVVAAHYRDLDQARLRTEVVRQDRYVHVSYRKGDQIFWTKNKVLLRQGETIITDGKTQVRARCGNCISEDPLLPTSEAEPEVVEFDRLVDTPAPTVPSAPVPTTLHAAPPPVDPFVPGPGVAGPEGGPIVPLAAGRLGSGAAPPLVAATGEPSAPGRPADIPPLDTPGPPSPPDPPGTDLPPFTPFPELPPPGRDNLPPLVPPEDFPPTDLPPDLPPPYVPPGHPVPVPEPGTLLLVGGGAMLARRLLKRRS